MGAPPANLSTEEVDAWERMLHWGLVPDAVYDLWRFAGVSDTARRVLAREIGKASRAAAAQAVWHGRAIHVKAKEREEEQAPAAEAEEGPVEPAGEGGSEDDSSLDGRSSDSEGQDRTRRGVWRGGVRGEDDTRQRQNQAARQERQAQRDQTTRQQQQEQDATAQARARTQPVASQQGKPRRVPLVTREVNGDL